VRVFPAPFSSTLAALAIAACASCGPAGPEWERDNPLRPLPAPPLGIRASLAELPDPPTPARVRLGRWLFYDARLSADGTVSCGTCHRPDQGFSQTERVSTGVLGKLGTRKSPSFVNQAWTLYPHFFWDGRAASLEEQALGPITNPVEMGLTHERLVALLEGIPAYAPYFTEAFGDDRITKERVAKAIADYERTRMAGNSAWDRWQIGGETDTVSEQAKQGHALFFGKAACNQCHLGENFTDSRFHNVGVGWDAKTRTFADEGRHTVTGQDVDRGAFKTPTLRDVTTHAPYMHDGSVGTLREAVELYNRGGTKNPWLSAKIFPLGLTDAEIDALVAFMRALDSDVPPEVPPTSFPR
jgi:cytochrome c peroxidase